MNLKPVLTRKGDDKTECISVEISVGNEKFVIVAGYGPQLGDPIERKTSFWEYLTEEADFAKEQNKGLIIQIDTNSWVGSEVIPNDPNKPNVNGKLMKQFLANNPALTVVNSLGCCDGTITRRRSSTLGEETSVLDVYIVCQKVLQPIKHMKIDHEEKYMLSNFRAKKNGKVTSSDHFPVILTLDLTIHAAIPKRKLYFNFKSNEGQVKFCHMKNNTRKLSKIFLTQTTFKKNKFLCGRIKFKVSSINLFPK